MHVSNRILASIIAVLGWATAVPAQDTVPASERIARIVAVVGDSVITNWDLQERMFVRAAQQQRQLPAPDTPEFQQIARAELEQTVNELMILQAAVRDTTLEIDEARLTQQVDDYIEQLRREYSGDAGLQAALAQRGTNLADYRESLIGQERRTATIIAFRQKAMQSRRPPPISEEEVRAFFESNRAQFAMRPATITLDQIFVPVTPSDSALAAAMVMADSLYRRIQAGESFEALAKQYSADPSAQLGGELGWHRRGQLVREFENAAFSPLLQIGAVTPPVRTEFGVHLIRLDRVRAGERQLRHILIRPEITDADVERARERAADVARRIEAGERATDLARSVGDADAQVRVGPLVRDSLPSPYTLLSNADRAQLASASAGAVVGPLLIDDTRTRRFLVARILSTEDARPATYEDYRDRIRQILAQQKLLEEILTELRRRTRVDLRLEAMDGGG